MSTSGLNKIVTSVSALTDNITLPNSNNVVCIDTENSRIGVKTSSPQYDIDVSGTIKANKIITSEVQSSTKIIMNEVQTNIINISNCAISFSNNNLTFDKSIFVNNDISCNNTIKGLTGKFGIASSTTLDSSFATINNLRFTNISGSTIYVNTIRPFTSTDISINANINLDGSLNMYNGVASIGILNLTSDDRLKHNEKIIDNALPIIRQLDPKIYQKTKYFKEANYNGPLLEPYIIEAGLIAQDVEKIDELSFTVVVGNEEKPYLLNYNNIFIYSLAALKELDNNLQIMNNKLNTSNPNGDNSNLANIINNQNILIEQLTNKIGLLENRIYNIEKAF